MASRRLSASSASSSDTTGSYVTTAAAMDAQQQQQQRRGGARFSRVLVEPSRAAVLLARSPVKTDASAITQSAVGYAQHQQRSTPQPARRSFISRLFRMKTSRNGRPGYTNENDTDDGDSESRSERLHASNAASPASHQSTPTHNNHHHHHSTTTVDAERLRMQAFSRAASMPTGVTQAASMDGESMSSETSGVTLLAEGSAVKLSSHKYWHAKATYFVLEEETTACEVGSRVVLRQFAKKGDDQPGTELLEIELTEFDVVVDISDRYIKYGVELLHRKTNAKENNKDKEAEVVTEELQSLRLSVDSMNEHRKWLRALGSAIARLIDQSKRHYPVDFVREKSGVFEPAAVSAIVAKSIPVRAVAKVMPMVTTGSEDEDEEERDQEDCGQANQDEPVHSSEMRDAEEPEIRSDQDEDGSQRSSLSAISDAFSDAWASPHHHNNNEDGGYASDDNNNHRSSNQFDDHDNLSDEETAAFARRLSESYSPNDLAAVAYASGAAFTHISPSGTSSVASTPSPQTLKAALAGGHSDEFEDDSSITDVVTSMAAAAVGTPPSTPPPPSYNHEKPSYARQRQAVLAASRVGPLARPQMHSFNANGQVFTLDIRYKLLKSIGNGAYGAVIAAQDSLVDMSVAVKKITNIFDDLVDAKRILREVRLLRHFHHKNITQLLDLAPPMTKKSFEDMYIITELMETDLHQVIYSMQPMSDDHVKYFLYQMLCALYHIHSSGVLHRDMKPSNILLNSNCDLKVCDFGLARGGMDADKDAKKLAGETHELTEYVVTRWYRAPEIMLNCLQYTAAVDVWAVGCIFAEMLLREPLFPGNDYMHQLKLIIKFLGTPKQEDISFIKNVKALRFLTKLSISKPKKWREVFTGEDLNPLALDLLAQMLIFNPDKRISVEKALQHPYLATFYDPADISRAPAFDFEFDLPDDKLTKDALVDLLCEDIACFHPALMQAMKQPPPPTHAPLPLFPRPPMANGVSGNGPGSTGNRYFGMTASAS